jgi:hypothetical protein
MVRDNIRPYAAMKTAGVYPPSVAFVEALSQRVTELEQG